MLQPDKGQDRSPGVLNRRAFIAASVSALTGLVVWHYRNAKAVAAGAAPAGQPKMVKIVEFSDERLRRVSSVLAAQGQQIVKRNAELFFGIPPKVLLNVG